MQKTQNNITCICIIHSACNNLGMEDDTTPPFSDALDDTASQEDMEKETNPIAIEGVGTQIHHSLVKSEKEAKARADQDQ